MSTQWLQIYDDSAYTLDGLIRLSGINESSIRKYLYHGRHPREPNRIKLEKAMVELRKHQRLKYHPSWGYATDEQVAELKSLGVGPTRDLLLKQIEEQTKSKGKHLS